MRRALVVVPALALAVAGCKQESRFREGSRTGSAAPTPTPTLTAKGSAVAIAVPRPASVTDDKLQMADAMAAAIEKLANELDASKADCKRAVAIAQAHNAEHAQLAATIAPLRALIDSDAAAKAFIRDHAKGKLSPAAAKLIAISLACKQEPGVATAISENALLKRTDASAP